MKPLRFALIGVMSIVALTAAEGIFLFYRSSVLWLLSVALLSAFFVTLFLLMARGLSLLTRRNFLILLVGTAATLRLAWIVIIPNKPVSDFAIYHELAVAMVSGHGYAITGPVGTDDIQSYIGEKNKTLPYTTAYRAPGVPIFAALLYKIVGVHPAVFKVFNVFFGVAIAVYLFLILERSPLAGTARLASILWAIYPTAVFATNLLGTELLFTFSITLVAYLISKDDPNTVSIPLIVATGVAIAWGALVRSMLWPLAGAAILTVAFSSKTKMIVPKITVLLIVIVIGLLPWGVRNWHIFHRVIPICTNEGMAVAMKTQALIPPPADTTKYDAWFAIENEAEKASQGYALASSNIKKIMAAGPGFVFRTLRANFKKIFQHDTEILSWSLTTAYGKENNYFPELAVNSKHYFFLIVVVTSFYIVALALGVIGAWRAINMTFSPGWLFLFLYFLAATSAHVLIDGQPRYHFAMMPFVLILASVGINRETSA